MREIRFRAWNIKEKRMIQNVQQEYDGIEEDCFAEFLGQESNHGRNGVFGKYEVMQFTGLKDKNGVEIYEGDIVKATIYGGDSLTGKVWWDQWQCGFMMIDKPMSRYMRDDDDTIFIEVLGNIYETPELLTTKEQQ